MTGQTTQVAEWRQEDPGVVPAGDVYGGGSPTGIAFYENGIMEDRFGGYVISCEPARNVLFGYHPKVDGAGITLTQKRHFHDLVTRRKTLPGQISLVREA